MMCRQALSQSEIVSEISRRCNWYTVDRDCVHMVDGVGLLLSASPLLAHALMPYVETA